MSTHITAFITSSASEFHGQPLSSSLDYTSHTAEASHPPTMVNLSSSTAASILSVWCTVMFSDHSPMHGKKLITTSRKSEKSPARVTFGLNLKDEYELIRLKRDRQPGKQICLLKETKLLWPMFKERMGKQQGPTEVQGTISNILW